MDCIVLSPKAPPTKPGELARPAPLPPVTLDMVYNAILSMARAIDKLSEVRP
jgi:hypothetical protein